MRALALSGVHADLADAGDAALVLGDCQGGMYLGGNDLVGAAGAGLVPRPSQARMKPGCPCRAGPQPQLRAQAERMSGRHIAVYQGTI